jgi:HSP20 family protein
MNKLMKKDDLYRPFGLMEKFFDDWDFEFNPWMREIDFPKRSINRINVVDNEKDYTIDVSVPGFKKEELNISIENGYLNVSGEHKEEMNETTKNYSRKEFSHSSFTRPIKLPKNITEEIDAKLEDGILTIKLNKKELPPKPDIKKIDIM